MRTSYKCRYYWSLADLMHFLKCIRGYLSVCILIRKVSWYIFSARFFRRQRGPCARGSRRSRQRGLRAWCGCAVWHKQSVIAGGSRLRAAAGVIVQFQTPTPLLQLRACLILCRGLFTIDKNKFNTILQYERVWIHIEVYYRSIKAKHNYRNYEHVWFYVEVYRSVENQAHLWQLRTWLILLHRCCLPIDNTTRRRINHAP